MVEFGGVWGSLVEFGGVVVVFGGVWWCLEEFGGVVVGFGGVVVEFGG